MRDFKKLYEQLPVKLDLMGESLGLPLVELIGDQRVIIEHHRGIVEYEKGKICVNTALGQIGIYGSGLELAKMGTDQLVILGRICRICIGKEGNP